MFLSQDWLIVGVWWAYNSAFSQAFYLVLFFLVGASVFDAVLWETRLCSGDVVFLLSVKVCAFVFRLLFCYRKSFVLIYFSCTFSLTGWNVLDTVKGGDVSFQIFALLSQLIMLRFHLSNLHHLYGQRHSSSIYCIYVYIYTGASSVIQEVNLRGNWCQWISSISASVNAVTSK